MPGFDKILYRALSLNPSHRYQRAFVMREDIRALMSGYSFSFIEQDTMAYLEPLFRSSPGPQPISIAPPIENHETPYTGKYAGSY